MKFLAVYARLYAECLLKAFKGIGKNPWTLLLPMGLWLGFQLIAGPISALGFAGGFILSLILDAVISCYLYFTGEVVAHTKVSVSEFKKSIGAYFWSVLNLGFVIWIATFVMGIALRNNPNGWLIQLGVYGIAAILLNAAPEVIYQKGTRNGVETIQRSARFIQENWIEWFIPNALVVAGCFFAFRALVLLGPLPVEVAMLVLGAIFHVFMIFRGHLFHSLDGSSHRQRMFKYRNSMTVE